MIIDAQSHLAAPQDRHWPPPGDRRSDQKRMPDAADLLEEMDRAGVDGLVLVPAGNKTGVLDNTAALIAVERFPTRFCVMGRLHPSDPDLAAKAAGWLAQPGMKGVRISFTAELATFDSLLATDLVRFWSLMERHGIPIALNAPGRTGDVAGVARRHPGLRLLIDHLGLAPGIRSGDVDTALAATLRLAEHPNVAVKASGLIDRLPPEGVQTRMHGCIRAAVQAFGARRVVWGSDLSNLAWDYRELVAFLRGLDFLTAYERAEFMGLGLGRWLNWSPSVPHYGRAPAGLPMKNEVSNER